MSVMAKLERIQNHLKSGKMISLKYVQDMLDHVIQLINEFNSTLSLMPVLWFGTNFAYASEFVVSIRHAKRVVSIIIILIYGIADNLTAISLVIYISCKREEVADSCDEIRRRLSGCVIKDTTDNNINMMSLSVFRTLDYLSHMKTTSFGFLVLDKKMVLAIARAVVSCTVLFVSIK